MKKIATLKKLMSVTLGAGLILLAAAGGPALAVTTFVGSISTADGCLVGTPNSVWGTGPSSLSWAISQNLDGTWHYVYDLVVPSGDVSHAIIETSNPFTNAFPDFYNAVGNFTSTSVGTFGPGTDNPNIPGSIFGIKFDGTTGTTVMLTFDSDRTPVWGDFYAKNGTAGNDQGVFNAVWNSSFTQPDPLDAATNGSINCKILRPDSPVPEPSALALVPMGLVPFIKLRRKSAK